VFNTPFRYIKWYEKQLAETEHVLIEELIEGEFRTFIDSNGAICQESERLSSDPISLLRVLTVALD
jgi:hypothetical protein